MIVADVMTKNTVTVSPDTKFKEIWKKIFSRHVNAIPVVDGANKLLGIITREDILTLLYPQYQDVMENFESMSDFTAMEGHMDDLVGYKAKDIMCKKVIYTRENTLIMRALSRMIVRSVNQLPVLSQTDKVVGILTKGDVFYALFKKRFSTTLKGHKHID